MRFIYLALVAARVLLSVLPSYIHPDEFFQGPEIAAGDILHTTALRTWEFDPAAPVRSIVPLYAFAAPPMLVLRLLGLHLTPWRLFASSRVFMALVSLAVDAGVYHAIRRSRGVRPALLLLASSHCLAVFHVHTFANAFASAVLATCFALLARARWLALGAGLALGCFAHVTFAAFALPLGVAALVSSSGKLTGRVVRLAAGGVLAATIIILIDSLYYGSLTIALVNNVAYNSRRENLAAHGIHPQYTHALVNMPLLFGPLCLVLALVRPRSLIDVTAFASVVCGVSLLSLAPHQEARFLLPALPGMAICLRSYVRSRFPFFWPVWIAFNAALFVVFGALHQAGVVPVIAHLAESVWPSAQCRVIGADALCGPGLSVAAAKLTTTVLLVSTYMAPRHLLAQTGDANARIDLVDLVGFDHAQIRARLNEAVHVNASLVHSAPAGELVFKQTATLLVVPGSVNINGIAPPDAHFHLVPVFRYAPHVNFDHMAETLNHPLQSSNLNSLMNNLQREDADDEQGGDRHRERSKLRAIRRRERETSTERAQRLEIERLRAAARRHNETPEEREIRRHNGRLRAIRRRENETEDERLRRRELNRIRMAKLRRSLKEEGGDQSSDCDHHGSPANEPFVGCVTAAVGFANHASPVPNSELSSAFSSIGSLSMHQQPPLLPPISSPSSDMAMLFHQPNQLLAAAAALNLPQLPVFANPFHVPAQTAVSSATPLPQLRHRHPLVVAHAATFPALPQNTPQAGSPPPPPPPSAPPSDPNYFYYMP
ncbi:alpha 1,2 mannosyltransferase [Coemansia sp. BCRC 34301]|nr:alpha 1,2 mannosyltransferase [Coemansia sp. BCRC 34301]